VTVTEAVEEAEMFKVNEIEVESPREMDIWMHGYGKGLETMRNLLAELDMLNTTPPSHGPGSVPQKEETR
jgi:hypothetical protein